MRPNDYIASEDVMALTDTEYDSFLNYIKFIGFNIWIYSHRINYSHSDRVLLLDNAGYLVWSPEESLGGNNSRIPLEEVKRMAALGMVV